MHILIRPASELAIKSANVQRAWIQKLTANIESALRHNHIDYKLSVKKLRIYAEVSSPVAAEVLQRVFGISSLSIVEHHCEPEVEKIKQIAIENYKEKVSGKTFRVRARRANVSGFSSKDVEVAIGSALYPHSSGVDLKNADFSIYVDVRREGAFFYTEKLQGAEGIPLGVQGRAVCLMSGGMDSPVAAWNLMKRGVELDFLFCNLAGAAYEKSVLGVTKTLVDRWSYGVKYSPKLFSVDFTEVINQIKTRTRPSYSQVLLKRAMYKAAATLAEKLEAEAIVTGEAIGQVSSQTLSNLAACEAETNIPVIRPLVCTDKTDIINLATRIGTFDLSKHIQEYCNISQGGAPVKIAINKYCMAMEEQYDKDLIENTVAEAKEYDLKTVNPSELAAEFIFKADVPEKAKVIDCRSQRHFDHWHYPGAEKRELAELLEDFSSLPKNGLYLFYCQWGTQTAVLCEKMQQLGYEAYSFAGGSEALHKYAIQKGISS